MRESWISGFGCWLLAKAGKDDKDEEKKILYCTDDGAQRG